MKIFHILPGLIIWLFSCSSPDTKKKSSEVSPRHDTLIANDSNPIAIDTTGKKEIISSSNQASGDDLPYPGWQPRIFQSDKVTVPSYGLDTVKALIAKVRPQADTSGGDDGMEALDERTYASLSLEQKFTYVMIHPESYSQMCDALPERKDEEHRIYGELPDIFGEFEWSERQLNFFKNNRQAVEALMKDLIEKNNAVKGNFKEAIVEMNAKELIPYLIEYYNKEKKDHYILTVLMRLMKDNKYPEFMNSASYKKLYKDEDSYSSYLVYNQANEDLIIKRAMNFYNGLSSK